MTTYYTKDHEWIRVEGDTGTIGITSYAAGQLGDIVYVELPEVGATLSKGDEFCVVEAVKTAAPVYMPISGHITESNSSIVDTPEKVNESPESEAWFVRIKIADTADLDGLMDLAAYSAYCEGL